MKLFVNIIQSYYLIFCIFLGISTLNIFSSLDFGWINFLIFVPLIPMIPLFFAQYVLSTITKYWLIIFLLPLLVIVWYKFDSKYKLWFASLTTLNLVSFIYFCFVENYNFKFGSPLIISKYAILNILLYFGIIPLIGLYLTWDFKNKKSDNVSK